MIGLPRRMDSRTRLPGLYPGTLAEEVQFIPLEVCQQENKTVPEIVEGLPMEVYRYREQVAGYLSRCSYVQV